MRPSAVVLGTQNIKKYDFELKGYTKTHIHDFVFFNANLLFFKNYLIFP